MNFDIERLIVASAFTAAFVGVAQADNFGWDDEAGDNDFFNPVNWINNSDGVNDAEVPINGNNLGFEGSAYTINIGATPAALQATAAGEFFTGRPFVDDGSTINILPGANILMLGLGGASRNDATWNQSGGRLVLENHNFATSPGEVATYNFSSGIFIGNTGQASSVPGFVDTSHNWGDDDGGIATFNISGDAQYTTRSGVGIGRNSSFNVSGSDAYIGIGADQNFAGSWYQYDTAVLSFEVADTGVSTVNIEQGTDATKPIKFVTFADGSILDLSFGDGVSTPTTETSYTLMNFQMGDTVGGISDLGLELSATTDASLWSFGIETSGDDSLLVATFTPSASFIDGDYNGDGFVSQADLDLVLLNWGDSSVPAEWLAADQFDGVQVSQNELDGVLLNWGDGTPPSVTTIPEPSVAALLGLGAATMLRRRQRVD